ncbi:MAG: ATP-binding protein [Candidatus Methanomethylophilaceae archaeon]|nr:ATP-binding protein [Candidatus Methanomethylophilaceae archaeon]
MTATVPKRTLITMMNALSSGVVPRRGLEYIAVGRKKETQTFVNDLEDTSQGGGAFRFISGRFGNGKSFMTQMIRNYAMDQGFVVMDADLAINRRLTGSKKEGLNTYMELIKNMAYKARPDGGAMEPILQGWVVDTKEKLGDSATREDIAKSMRSDVANLSSLQNFQDFMKVVICYMNDFLDEKDDITALRWFKGELDLKKESRKSLGTNLVIDDSNWYDIVKIWTGVVRCLGFKGMVVFIDEGVVLYKLQNKISRSNNYERLLTMFNDIMQGKTQYLSIYVCGTPEFIEDPNRGLYSYEALRSRLVAGRYENGFDNYLGPIINLKPLTNEEVFVLLGTIKDLHEQRYEYESGITDDMLETYLKTVMSSVVSSTMLTPREITRDLISLLDTMHQNPDLEFLDLVEGRVINADSNPDDEIIEDLDV